MADNLNVTPGVGAAVAADEVGGFLHQRIKLSVGADGSATDAVGGAGVVGAGVPRITLADDDVLVTRTGALTESAPGTDTASSGLNGRMQRIAQRLTSLIGVLPASLGVKADTASLAVTASTEDVARVGATNESAAASDTATSGLNGLLKRIAQNITSAITAISAVRTWKFAAYGSATTLLSTELNSLADNAESAASATFDNSSDRNRLADFELNLAATSARSADNVVLLYMKVRIDGTNFTGTNSSVARLCGGFGFDAATTTWRGGLFEVPLPPEQLQFFVRNQLGVAFAASGSTLKIRPYNPVS